MMELDVATRRVEQNSGVELPFRILILGDFGAPTTRPVTVDRDNFDELIARLGVKLTLPVTGEIQFTSLDDFHPDGLYARVDAFRALREARRRLEDPATFQATAKQLQNTSPTEKPNPAAFLNAGSLLDEIVEGHGEGAAASSAADPFTEYVRRIAAPYLVPRPDPKQAEMLAQIDAATAGLMRALLHRPEFQALEAAWRALFFLICNIETGVDLKVYLLNLPKQALTADLLPASDLSQTALYKVLIQDLALPGSQPWSVIAGNYTFTAANDDVELLGRIGLLASSAHTPFFAAAAPEPGTWLSPAVAWRELQQIPEARYLGVALPRFLLRLPYGENSSNIESFVFEEMPDGSKHDEYLWGNPVFACVRLLAEAFSLDGWALRPGTMLDIDGLPIHVYREDGEPVMKSCTEFPISYADAQKLIENGLMPLVSMKDSDRIHLAGFRAVNGEPLAGPWS
ncbi:MAG TPA: type VI secretion system contractile sheath large subunit [Bryobacteraceae bacterium]|nr:type VI secretion system contractile sheath large subunit [Bryobacteraceae bacterium]